MRNFLEEKVEFCISIAGKRYTAARFTGRWWWWCWFLSEHIGNSTFRAGGHRRTDKVSGSSDPKILNKGKQGTEQVFPCSSQRLGGLRLEAILIFSDRVIKFRGKLFFSRRFILSHALLFYVYMIRLYLRKKLLFLSVNLIVSGG